MGEVLATCPRANWTGFEAKRAALWAFCRTLQQRLSNILHSVLFLKVKTNLRVPKNSEKSSAGLWSLLKSWPKYLPLLVPGHLSAH